MIETEHVTKPKVLVLKSAGLCWRVLKLAHGAVGDPVMEAGVHSGVIMQLATAATLTPTARSKSLLTQSRE